MTLLFHARCTSHTSKLRLNFYLPSSCLSWLKQYTKHLYWKYYLVQTNNLTGEKLLAEWVCVLVSVSCLMKHRQEGRWKSCLSSSCWDDRSKDTGFFFVVNNKHHYLHCPLKALSSFMVQNRTMIKAFYPFKSGQYNSWRTHIHGWVVMEITQRFWHLTFTVDNVLETSANFPFHDTPIAITNRHLLGQKCYSWNAMDCWKIPPLPKATRSLNCAVHWTDRVIHRDSRS